MACMAGWGFPDVIDQERKVRERPFFVLTLHVGNTRRGHRGSKAANRPPAKVTERSAKSTGPPAKVTERPARDHRTTSKASSKGPTDRREDGLVLLRKKFEVQQALFEVGAADADADFVTEAVDLMGAAAAQAVFLLFKLEEIRLYVTE